MTVSQRDTTELQLPSAILTEKINRDLYVLHPLNQQSSKQPPSSSDYANVHDHVFDGSASVLSRCSSGAL